MDELLTVKEVARGMGVGPSMVYHLAHQGAGGLPSIRIGRFLRFREEDVSKFLRKRKQSGNNAEILGLRKGVPIVAVWRIPQTLHLVFRCPWCGRLHFHGVGERNRPLGAGDGHSTAGCFSKESEVNDCGYYLKEVANFKRAGISVREAKTL